MFRVNINDHSLVPLERKRFGDLDIRERADLQEWLVQSPESLGEDLLIIQKEFDGFQDTRERLDVLALDRQGRLVIIENKLDDSGRDVVWQALKYVAYCSTLRKADLIDIYQKYLDRWDRGTNASDKLCNFLEVDDLESTVMNAGNEQRLMLVSANFRKEVTSTALWLIGHGITVQCFKVTPYVFQQELFVDLQQIIPTPEAADFMIGMADKESEEKVVRQAKSRRHILRKQFWGRTLEVFRDRKISRFDNISPSTDHWLACGTGVRGCQYGLIFSKKEARVELLLGRPHAEENKWLFQELYDEKCGNEVDADSDLYWDKQETKIRSRIWYSQSFDGFDENKWNMMIEWLCEHFLKLENTFSDSLTRLNNQLRSKPDALTFEEREPRI